jgi:Tol biopolymer transport system component
MKSTFLIIIVVATAGILMGCSESEATEMQAGYAAVNLGAPINTDSSEYNPEVSEDGLTLVYSSRRPGGFGSNDIWMSKRASIDAPWEEPQNLGPEINTEHWETGPSLTGDMLELYFTSTKFDTGARDIYVARRASVDEPFGNVERLGDQINTPDYAESGPYVSYDGLVLVFSSDRPGGEGGRDLYMSTRPSRDEPFGTAKNLGPVVNSRDYDSSPTMTSDKLALLFHSRRHPDRVKHDLYVTYRDSLEAPWSEPVSLGDSINTPRYNEGTPSISADGTTLLFRSERKDGHGGQDIWMVTLPPGTLTGSSSN